MRIGPFNIGRTQSETVRAAELIAPPTAAAVEAGAAYAPGIDGLGVEPIDLSPTSENDAPSPVAASFAIIKLLAGVQGTLPRLIHERDDVGRRPVRTPETSYLWSTPNSDWKTGSLSFWVPVFAHLEGWNNAFIWPRRVGRGGRIVGIDFIHPGRVWPDVNSDGDKIFKVYQRGQPQPAVVTTDELLHIFGLSFDGISGVRPVRASVATHEHAMLLDRWGRNFLRRGGRYSGMVSTDQQLNDDDLTEWEDLWERQNSGAAAVGKTILMDRGATYQQMTIPPEEAQYLETRQYSREEVLGVYAPGLPHHLVGWKSNTSNFGTGIEAQGVHLHRYVLSQRLRLIADAVSEMLLPPDLVLEFDVGELLKADMKVQSEVLLKERQAGVLSAEQWREKRGYEPRAIDDDYTYQKNMTVVSASGDEGIKFEPDQAEQQRPSPGLPGGGAVLAEGRCGNSLCESRKGGRPGRLLARRVAAADVPCPTCGEVTSFSASETLRDERDLAAAISEQLARPS